MTAYVSIRIIFAVTSILAVVEDSLYAVALVFAIVASVV